MALLQNVGTTLEMIKWEHSIFALPFALARRNVGRLRMARLAQTFFWIVVCMVTARSAAMAFNRWADARLDAAQSPNCGPCDSGRHTQPVFRRFGFTRGLCPWGSFWPRRN